MEDLIAALAHFCRGQGGTELKLWDIPFDASCCRHLVKFLTTNSSRIKSLRIQNCTFANTEGAALGILCDFFSNMSTHDGSLLQAVSIKKCQLGNAGIHQLLESFHFNTQVKSLDISYNGLYRAAGAQAVEALLRKNTTLANLNVSGNALVGRDAVYSLRRGLVVNDTLQSLNMSSCQLENDDLHHLVVGEDKKQRLTTFALTELWLENNQLQGASAGRSLQRLVQEVAPHLQVLSLDSNRLGPQAGRLVAASIASSSTKLQRLFVSCCHLCEEGKDAIVAAMHSNTSLLQLHISGNTMTNDCSTPNTSTTAQQEQRKRLVQVYTKRNALWTRVVQPLLSPQNDSQVQPQSRSPLWATALVTCAAHQQQQQQHYGAAVSASAVYALVSEMVGLDFFCDK